MRKIGFLSIILVTMSLIFSCSKESELTTNLQLGIKTTLKQLTASGDGLKTSPYAKTIKGEPLVLDKFLINISEIEFEFEKPYAGFTGPYNCECEDEDNECEIKFKGSYIIDIASPEALTGLLLGNFPLPSAIYDEIELDITPSRNNNNVLINGRSVYISGQIGEKPFQLWTNSQAELEIEFPGRKKIDLTKEDASLWIKISLDKILANLESIDLSSAVDGNGNGIIEIGHDDPDGNNALATLIFNSFKGSFELDD